MRRYLHYETAFEDYLRTRGIPYVPVDETRKVIFSGIRIKSFDFLVYPAENCHWIVDVKGRKFPYGKKGSRSGGGYWENWVTREDVDGLSEWQEVFGPDFEARFVFAYLLSGTPDHWPPGRPHCWRGQFYAFFTVSISEYIRHCRQRSARWDTVTVPRQVFRTIAKPLANYCSRCYDFTASA